MIEIAVLLNAENITIDGESSSFDSFEAFPYANEHESLHIAASVEELTACSLIVVLPIFTAFYINNHVSYL